MRINPPITDTIIFSGGGGLVIRKQKAKVSPGKNNFEIMDVPASFDPEQVIVEIVSEFQDKVKLSQLSIKLPDKTIVNMGISRERTASNNIITNATDLRAESRKKILAICESAYYRQYEDMFGEIDIVVASEGDAEINLTLKYFIIDLRIRWKPGVQVDLDEKNNVAKIVGYINVDNNSDFIFENVELEFAEFDLAPTPVMPVGGEAEQQAFAQMQIPANENILRNIQRLKRRFK